MKIIIASDHAGYLLKEEIKKYLQSKNNFTVADLGTEDGSVSVDYPDYAQKVAKAVAESVKKEKNTVGILICGTGMGMCITANKVKGIRAVVVSDSYCARMSKLHNNANILCLGSRVIGSGLAIDVVETWLSTEFEGSRHKKRIDMISKIEEEN